MKDSVQKQENIFSSLENENRLLERNNEKVIRRCGEQKTTVRGSVAKPVKTVAMFFTECSVCQQRYPKALFVIYIQARRF